MRFTKTIVASVAILASASASAVVTGSLGGGAGPFLTLSGAGVSSPCAPCTLGPGVATITGGMSYAADQTQADDPNGFVGRFLAAGPSSGSPSTLTFTPGVSYVSFLWGSPDSYNTLTVNGNPFTVASLGLPGNGDQSFASYVQFTGVGEFINTIVFSSGIDAFEVANFSTTVPEPGTLALFGAGLVGMWMAVRRRKVSIDSGRGLTAA